jgi:Uma2 family endonuclease
MNAIVIRIPKSERHIFTVDDVLRMQDIGVIDDDMRLELFEGELVRMQSKNYAHERIKIRLVREFNKRADDKLWEVGIETTAYLSNITALDPDVSLIPAGTNIRNISGPSIPLVVEVADRSLSKDRGPKARLYAKYGVQELWVIDARKLLTYRFARPVEGLWQETTVLQPDDVLTHELLPGMAVKLSEL